MSANGLQMKERSELRELSSSYIINNNSNDKVITNHNNNNHKNINNKNKLTFNCINNKNNVCVFNDNKMLSNNNKSKSHSTEAMNSMANDFIAINSSLNCSDSQINVLSNETQMSLKSNNSKSETIKESIQHSLSEKTKKKIAAIINEIDGLNDIEKLWLYLQLPNGSAQEVDPLKQKGPGNPFGKKADIEVAQTYTWIQSHLEEDSTVSLPKQEVYEEYKAFCDANKFEPLCVADFGKAMKHVFPKVKPRRLGQRGNSKYCYSGLRKKITIDTPELPILDTSGYDCPKNDKSLDFSRNKDNNYGKCVFSEECVNETEATNLIIEWASKLLNHSFDSIPELAQFLYNLSSVNIRCDTMTAKSNEDKQHLKSNSKSTNSSRRRDIQNQLQRKIHEKEANKEIKKKSELNKSNDNLKSLQNASNNTKSIKKNRKNSASKSSDEFECPSAINSQNAITIKKEPDIALSPTFQTNQIIQQNRFQNKVAIPRTGTPSRLTQPAISTSIILVPTATVRLASPQSSMTCESTATTTVSTISSSPLKPTTSKYKRIQPKPVNISRSDSESAVSVAHAIECTTSEAFGTTAKRRHSVSVPLRIDNAIKLKSNEESFNDKHLQSKRQIEEREGSAFVTTKKRHIDNVNEHNANHAIFSNSTNTNSSGFDDANSSNSLSPISQELQTINSESIGASDIRIQEIESEALMDYFSTNPMSVTNSIKDQWDCSHSNNKCAQLSQLRKLLENHLPNNMNKSVQQRIGDQSGVQLECYSELREALLRKNLSHSVQTFGTLKPTNEPSNEQNVITLSSKDKEYSKSRQIDGLVTSPVLDNMHCISSTTVQSSLFTNSDYSIPTNQLFNDNNNGIHTSVQVPSVPPSPNARRRAFNFQPISPRNTPTIPENQTIETIAYNHYNSLNNTVSSPPQYRLNQQTVGVGPSQPSSEANSPFVSPRSTPTHITHIPLSSRSRHNSGQSSYSIQLRQTPLQNFDSGVSSISSSPFISPQSTPVPISRVRAGTGGMQRNLSRARHSSGPGGPCNMSLVSAASLLCHRSNSLSPMIGDTFTNTTHNSLTQMVFNEMTASQMTASQVTSVATNANASKCETPNSPLSPIAVLNQLDVNPLTCDSLNGSSSYVFNQECGQVLQNDWTSTRIKTGMTNNLVNRHRHSSNPYPSAPVNSVNSLDSLNSVNSINLEQFSPEILSFMKNSTNETSENKSVLNRCQSVPVHQMINSNISIGTKNGHQLSSANSLDLGNDLLSESTSISKSYPATPICNQNFQFPPSPPSSIKLQSVIGSDDIISGNVLQSGQDLMVSGVQLRDDNVWNTNCVASHQSDNELISINTNSIGSNSSNARRNLSELLAEPPDDLQTTLEDLRDCDNDFSKFAQELEATHSYDDNDCLN